MDKPSNLTVIRNRIKKALPGTVYVAVDFVNISDKTNINAYLAVLAEQGVLHRVLRIYVRAIVEVVAGEFHVAVEKIPCAVGTTHP